MRNLLSCYASPLCTIRNDRAVKHSSVTGRGCERVDCSVFVAYLDSVQRFRSAIFAFRFLATPHDGNVIVEKLTTVNKYKMKCFNGLHTKERDVTGA
ncbi:hypothetical protein RRG08_025734 [Elysia crispata]|uniref:Uncharacterized protein n=1 Tax=Elysia crispata TaxID=231223 RepID=A0AAE1DZM6_9GAST|nr:hypothetical protein RRG08_025734 [Elysia crispata]